MIDETFIQAAIKIRREYLKLVNNLNFYKKQANKVIGNLQDIINKLENISNGAESDPNSEATSVRLLEVLSELEREGKTVNELIDPLNVKIERLAIEENQLWNKIKQKHSDIPDIQIIEYVKSKLIEQNLQ
ncbi:MAG: hypothetical protein EBU90_23570 [Proteobacteria bacterium]|nr:hypothetical protein [Pseudomonadota bacterium]NBP16196.1 hypothetical protein [bacterium]